jgi:ATP-dependent Zn protease
MIYSSPRFLASQLHRHGRSVAEDLRVAAHESGHAILRWVNGRSIGGITVDPREIDGRKINGRTWGDPANCEDSDSYYFGRIVELVAGSVGEEVYLGEAKGLKGSDRRKAYRCASALCESEDAASLLIRAAKVEAAHVITEHRHVLEALVTGLCDSRTLSGGDVLGIIRRAAGQRD